jgi:hypothetical protein
VCALGSALAVCNEVHGKDKSFELLLHPHRSSQHCWPLARFRHAALASLPVLPTALADGQPAPSLTGDWRATRSIPLEAPAVLCLWQASRFSSENHQVVSEKGFAVFHYSSSKLEFLASERPARLGCWAAAPGMPAWWSLGDLPAARLLQAACHQCAPDTAGPGLRLGRQAPRPWQPEWPGRACRLVPAHWHWQARGRRCAAARLERAQ